MANLPGSLRDDMRSHREFLSSRAPAYARLLELLDAELERGLEARVDETWRGRQFGAWYERPLLLCNALRCDALREGRSHPLWRAIADPEPTVSALSESAVGAAVAPERTFFWRTLSERRLQTNEPSRAVAWLWPARIAAGVKRFRAMELFDVGSSAGLNLIGDQLPPMWETADGAELDVELSAPIVRRTGFDLRPLDVLDEEDARWLKACVWPGQREREERLEQAVAAFRKLQSAPGAPSVHLARAGEVPSLLPHGADGRMALVCQTIVRDYLPPSEWRAYQAGLQRWLLSRPPGSAMWVELEVSEEARAGGPPIALTVHVQGTTGPCSVVLAHCEPHPRHLDVDVAAVAALRAALET